MVYHTVPFLKIITRKNTYRTYDSDFNLPLIITYKVTYNGPARFTKAIFLYPGGGALPVLLHAANTTAISNEDCATNHWSPPQLNAGHICFFMGRHTGACNVSTSAVSNVPEY